MAAIIQSPARLLQRIRRCLVYNKNHYYLDQVLRFAAIRTMPACEQSLRHCVVLERYYREILSFLSGQVSDRSMAADLAQESYARVYAAQLAGAGIVNPRALLYRTARNLVIDHYRHAEVRTGVELPACEDEVAQVHGPRSLEPEVAAASQQGIAALAHAIDNLPPRCRQAFMLNRIEGLSYADVSARMGISVKMVEQHLKLALDACDRCLAQTQGKGDGQATAPVAARPRRKAVALGAYALMALGSGAWFWDYRHARPIYVQAFRTGRGEQSDVPLPDGTTLRLDTATRVEVAYYRQRRELTLLEGQIYLAVHHDANSPFQVRAGAVRVTVLGTRFAVRHTPGQPGADGVAVVVTEGRVSVEGAAGAAASRPSTVILTAGQQVAGDRHGVLGPVRPVTAAQAAQFSSWQHYQLRFDNRRLDHVLAELARYGDWPLVIRDPRVAALRLTAVVDPRDVATFQRALPLSLPVRLVDLDGRRKELVLR